MTNICLCIDSWRTKTDITFWLALRMPLNLPHQLICHSILMVIYLTSTSGCWRRQFQTDDDAVASVDVELTSTTTQMSHHRLECRQEEAAYAGCLNGGTCFVVALHMNSRHVQCSCTSEWQGARCESLYIDPDHWSIEEAKEQATKLAIVLAFGITATLLLILLIAFTVVYMRRKHKRAEEKRKNKEEEKRSLDDLQAGRSTSVAPLKSLSSHQQQRTIVIPISTV